MGFPRSHRYIIIWWVSGWLAFSFGRFTVDLELAKFSSISWGKISVFSPKVRCGSKKFCIWKQTVFSKLILLWLQNLTCRFSPLELQLSKQWPGYLFTFHKRRSFQTPLDQRFSTGATLPPRRHLAVPGGSSISLRMGWEWWTCHGHPVGST